MPHSIRLRGPWHIVALGRVVAAEDGSWALSADDLPPPCTAEMPADWSGPCGSDFRGLVRYRRTFHRPTGLEARSRVWLVVENIDFQAAVTLNDQPLGVVQRAGSSAAAPLFDLSRAAVECPARFEITALLSPSNALQLDVLLPPDSIQLPRADRHGLAGGLIGLVRLEIE